MERENAITMKSNPLTLIGDEVKIGQRAPNFTAVANDLTQVEFKQLRGRTVVICSVPSLDTPVCDRETRRFNEEAAKFDENVTVLTISMDLPFAQKRWCGAAQIDQVTTWSDYQQADFGTKYGLLIKGLRLLARAVIIVDADGIIRYKQLVPEITQEPDYAPVLEAVKQASTEYARK
ncbi:MAG: thiol peroxidase [Planctomycetaceae bacterium]|nr:thiol peroxidase [Planctomycetaceae bacterium]